MDVRFYRSLVLEDNVALIIVSITIIRWNWN